MQVEIESADQLKALLSTRNDLVDVVVQAVDLRPFKAELGRIAAKGAVFLGCAFDEELLAHALATGGLVFPDLPEQAFRPYRATLYTPDELLAGYERGNPASLFSTTNDAKIYQAYQASRARHSLLEALSQRLHDHAVDDALQDLLNDPKVPRKVVAIMGGHAASRRDREYRDVARIARRLTAKGYFLVSGGGPGQMEATNLGAWFAKRDEADLDAAIAELALAPTYRDQGWLESALDVRARATDGAQSLGVPTWFYGHEPSNVFSTHIAKYFSNSLREDGLLAIARHGVIFAPGSAGTIQEIFQDAAQNHYGTFTDVSPMILFGKTYWTEDRPVWPLLQALSRGKQYEKLLAVEDDVDAVVRAIETRPPVRYET